MIRSLPRGALLVAMVATLGGAGAASTASVSLFQQAEQASLVETWHVTDPGAAVVAMKTQYFANEEVLVSWDDRQVVALCRRAAYLKPPAGTTGGESLPIEQRQMIAYQALMTATGTLGAVAEAVGDTVLVADDGSEIRRSGESSWAYGVERYEVLTQRRPDGALRIRALKTGTVNNATPAGPEDHFSTEDDQAARLAELAPVGSWTEVVIHGGPRQAGVDPAMTLQGWLSMGNDRPATVAEARRIHGCR